MTAPSTAVEPTAGTAPARPTDAGPVLEVRNLSVAFDGFKALSGVNLSVGQGELRFLIGPNGAGKTTLVDAITGLAKSSDGTVHFDGSDITGWREHKIVRRGIGRSFQTPTVFERLTVAQNLDLAESFRRPMISMFRRHGRTTDGIQETLSRIGLSAKAQDPAGILSHGQKQWLEIGMLLVQRPKLLMLDELVAGMSPQERLDTGALLQDLVGDHTIVVIEHDMAFLRRFASSVTVLHEGKILSEGTVDEVRADPKVGEVYLGRARDERSGASLQDRAVPTAADESMEVSP